MACCAAPPKRAHAAPSPRLAELESANKALSERVEALEGEKKKLEEARKLLADELESVKAQSKDAEVLSEVPQTPPPQAEREPDVAVSRSANEAPRAFSSSPCMLCTGHLLESVLLTMLANACGIHQEKAQLLQELEKIRYGGPDPDEPAVKWEGTHVRFGDESVVSSPPEEDTQPPEAVPPVAVAPVAAAEPDLEPEPEPELEPEPEPEPEVEPDTVEAMAPADSDDTAETGAADAAAAQTKAEEEEAVAAAAAEKKAAEAQAKQAALASAAEVEAEAAATKAAAAAAEAAEKAAAASALPAWTPAEPLTGNRAKLCLELEALAKTHLDKWDSYDKMTLR